MYRRENSLGLRWKSAKPAIESVTRLLKLRLFSSVSEHSTYLADNFFKANFSCKIVITVPWDTPMASTIYRVFARRSLKIKSWTISMISGVAVSTGRPKRGSSRVDARTRLTHPPNCKQLWTMVEMCHELHLTRPLFHMMYCPLYRNV